MQQSNFYISSMNRCEKVYVFIVPLCWQMLVTFLDTKLREVSWIGDKDLCPHNVQLNSLTAFLSFAKIAQCQCRYSRLVVQFSVALEGWSSRHNQSPDCCCNSQDAFSRHYLLSYRVLQQEPAQATVECVCVTFLSYCLIIKQRHQDLRSSTGLWTVRLLSS